MSAFAVELKRLRKLRLLTQQKLSDAARVPLRTISDLERGVSQQPHPDTVRKLAAALGLAGAELAGFHAAARVAADQRAEREAKATGRGHGGVAAARTLPRDADSFTGRTEQLAELLDVADPAAQGSIWVVDGMAGVGKTTFALHAAHQLAGHFPDGQLFLELRGHVPDQPPADPADALASLLQTLGVDAGQIPPGTPERARLWRDRLAGKQLLLLLDDAAGSEQVRPLLPGTPGCLVLVTSRPRLTALENIRVVSLGIMGSHEAALLFVRLAARTSLSPGDPAIQEIVRLCGYLPLAIAIMAARLRHRQAWTPAWLAADLAAARSRPELMRAENQSVAAAFTLSYKDLGHGEQELFRRLGSYPGTDIDRYAAAALNGTDPDTARRQLDALYDRHLISEPYVPGRYLLHDLLREHARDLAEADPPAARRAAISRLLDYYLSAARAAGKHLAKQPPPGADMDGVPEIGRAHV